jgi:uncharacterized protein with HEPN domain
MRHDSRAYLWNVREAADAILRFIAGIDFDTYASTEMLYSAVERKFEIIGEALNQLSKADPALATRIPDLDRIVAFRNLLIHGYAVVDHLRVWRIARESLPALRVTIATLLDELGPTD